MTIKQPAHFQIPAARSGDNYSLRCWKSLSETECDDEADFEARLSILREAVRVKFNELCCAVDDLGRYRRNLRAQEKLNELDAIVQHWTMAD